MAVFEIEKDGKVYEVEAPDGRAALAALDKMAGPQAAAPAADPMAGFNADPMGSMLRANAEQNQAQSKAMGAGVVEGARQLWDGLKQAYGNAVDSFDALTKGKPIRSPDVRDPVTGQITRGQQLDSSQGLKQTAEGIIRQQVQTEVDRQRGVNVGLRDVAAGVTQGATLAIAPEAGLPRATGVLGAALKNSTAGIGGAAVQFNADNDSGRDMILAGAAGPVLGFIPSLAPSVKNAVGRALRRISGEGRVAARVDNARATLPNVDYSLAQVTGIPELVSLERAAYDSRMVNFFADQTDSLIADAANALRQPIRPGADMGVSFANARELAQSSLTALRMNASNSWEAGLDGVRATARAEGATARVPVSNFQQQFFRERDAASNVLRQMDRLKVPPRAMRAMQEAIISDPQTMQAGMSVEQLSDLMVGLTGLARNSDDVAVRGFAGRMREAVDRDLDALGDQPGSRAAAELLETRAEYRRAMTAARELSETAAYKLMGVGDEAAPSPDFLLQRYSELPMNQQVQARGFMQQNAPELLTQLKQQAIDDAVRRAGTIRAAADSQQSLEGFTDAFFDGKNGFMARTEGLWNGEELRRIEGIKDGLRVISTNRPVAGAGSGTRILPEDIAINLVSRHSAFVARQLTRVLMSAKASQFFTDPQVYESLSRVGRTATGTPTNLMARGALLELLQTEYAEEGQ